MNRLTGLLIAAALAATPMSIALAAAPAPVAPAAPAQPTTAIPASPQASEHHALMSRQHVKSIQTALNGMGEKVAVDGIWGPKTGSALRDFQQKHGLKATGRADATTLRQLKVTM